MSKTFVYYHGGGCYDGFTAAWIAQRALPYAVLLPAVYQKPLPRYDEIASGDVVYFVDFSIPRDRLLALSERCRVVVLDHHVSAQRDLANLTTLPNGGCIVFDVERSGAGLTWDWFFSRETRPIAINFVEDRDLWAGRLQDTARFHAYLTSLPMEFEQWDIAMDNDNLGRALSEGGAIERTIRQYAEKAMAFSSVTSFCSLPAVFFNLPPMNVSETLHVALQRFPACRVAASYQVRGDRLAVSLRSRPGETDVSLLAKMYGGGGHAQAAGFEVLLTNSAAYQILGLRL